MNSFIVIVQGKKYEVRPGLHDGFYTVTCAEKSAMIRKDANGAWEFSLESSNPLDISAGDLGAEIEKAIVN